MLDEKEPRIVSSSDYSSEEYDEIVDENFDLESYKENESFSDKLNKLFENI